MEKPYINFDLDNNQITFYGEFQEDDNDFVLNAFNYLNTKIKEKRNEEMTLTFIKVLLKNDVYEILTINLLSIIEKQNIKLKVLWHYHNKISLDAGEELAELFDYQTDFVFYEHN